MMKMEGPKLIDVILNWPRKDSHCQRVQIYSCRRTVLTLNVLTDCELFITLISFLYISDNAMIQVKERQALMMFGRKYLALIQMPDCLKRIEEEKIIK